jgi:hypothetical protein
MIQPGYDPANKTVNGIPKLCFLRSPKDLPHVDDDALDFIRTTEDLAAIGRYLDMRRNGESHRMAEILATGKFPGLNTDTTFLAGHHNGNQFEHAPGLGDWLKRKAEAAGVNTNGAIYLRGLAKFPGDPGAWVTSKGDVARIAEERGWGVDGSVKVERREVGPMPDVAVAEDIVDDAARYLLEQDPDMPVEEARERAFKIRSGQVDNDAPRVAPVEGIALDYSPDF